MVLNILLKKITYSSKNKYPFKKEGPGAGLLLSIPGSEVITQSYFIIYFLKW